MKRIAVLLAIEKRLANLSQGSFSTSATRAPPTSAPRRHPPRSRPQGWIPRVVAGPLAIGALLGACSAPAIPDPQLVIGSWECLSGVCPDPVIQFAAEEEAIYRSWLHQRPGVIDARWRLEGRTLTITFRDGQTQEWEVVAVDSLHLQLRGTGYTFEDQFHRDEHDATTVFRRLGC